MKLLLCLCVFILRFELVDVLVIKLLLLDIEEEDMDP